MIIGLYLCSMLDVLSANMQNVFKFYPGETSFLDISVDLLICCCLGKSHTIFMSMPLCLRCLLMLCSFVSVYFVFFICG